MESLERIKKDIEERLKAAEEWRKSSNYISIVSLKDTYHQLLDIVEEEITKNYKNYE